jgi:DnaJ-class molecular chaperone
LIEYCHKCGATGKIVIKNDDWVYGEYTFFPCLKCKGTGLIDQNNPFKSEKPIEQQTLNSFI